jgi:hypothetical protein
MSAASTARALMPSILSGALRDRRKSPAMFVHEMPSFVADKDRTGNRAFRETPPVLYGYRMYTGTPIARD